MEGLFFITDVHLCGVCSSRVDPPWEALKKKLSFVVDYCNAHHYGLVIGGDLFDTPTVSFELYNGLVGVLSGLVEPCWVVWGNHDMLYRSMSNAHKCSLYTLGASGVVRLLTGAELIKLGSETVYLTSQLPLMSNDCPQVLVYHGFLEIKDGAFTVSQADLLGCKTPAVVLLGHDHAVYDDVVLPNGVRIVRCGSFYRNRREASCYRGVFGCVVRWVNGALFTERVAIPCKSAQTVFAVKDSASLVHKSAEVDYGELVKLLQNASRVKEATFEGALRCVASPQEVEYILNY